MTNPHPPLSVVHYLLLPEAIATLLVAFYPSPIWRFSGLAVVSSLYFFALFSTTGDDLQDLSLGGAIAVEIMNSIAHICLINPIRDYRYAKDVIPPNEQPWLRRIYLAFILRHSPRGIGWNYQVSYIPALPTHPRWSFVRQSLVRSFCLFLLLDLSNTYLSCFPLFSQADVYANSSPIPLLGQVLDGIGLVAHGTTFFAIASLIYAIMGTVSVAAGLSEPRLWPKLFGHWSDAYTVRRFWGRTWHQGLRQVLTIYGKSLTRYLGFQPGSLGSSYTQLYVAFILSGIVHCGGDLMLGQNKYLGLSFPFFFLQAVVITLEDAFLALVKMSGTISASTSPSPSLLARLVGYSWVVFWFYLSLPWHLRWFANAGILHPLSLPFSPITVVIHNLEKVGMNTLV